MSSSRSFAAHAALAALLAAPAVGAQQPRALDLQPSATVASFATPTLPVERTATLAPADSARPIGGAPIAGASVAVRAPVRSHAAAPAVAAAAPLRQSQVLMVVGGAAIVIGLLAGGDAQAPLVVGGAVVGLFGLYQYLR